jgi:nucleoside-diphosphate-sugar epimerase
LADPVIVTGGSGFIGSHLVRRLVEAGEDVVVTVRTSSSLWRLGDVAEWVREVPARGQLPPARLIFHLAATGVRPGEDAATVLEENVLGTLRLLEHAAATGAERFVHCGSCFEYGPGERLSEDSALRPISEYGASKAAGSLLALAWGAAHGLPVVVVRPFTAYGPFEASYRLVPSTILDALDGGPIRITSGGQMRDFVYVEDVVGGLVAAAATDGLVQKGVNLCSGAGTPVARVAELVSELVGDVDVVAGALEDRPVEFHELSGDPTLAAEAMGWTAATSLEAGLRSTIDWLQEQRSVYPEYARGARAA